MSALRRTAHAVTPPTVPDGVAAGLRHVVEDDLGTPGRAADERHCAQCDALAVVVAQQGGADQGVENAEALAWQEKEQKQRSAALSEGFTARQAKAGKVADVQRIGGELTTIVKARQPEAACGPHAGCRRRTGPQWLVTRRSTQLARSGDPDGGVFSVGRASGRICPPDAAWAIVGEPSPSGRPLSFSRFELVSA